MLAIFLIAGGPVQVAASTTRCFEPLDDPTKHDPDLFKDIYQRKATGKAEGVKRFLPIEGGKKGANIDFYYIDFVPRAGQTPKDAFKEIRIHFPDFAAGTANEFAFGAYRSSLESTDKLLAKYKEKWESDDPTGALMTFNLDTMFPSAFLSVIGYKAQPGRARLLREKAGDV